MQLLKKSEPFVQKHSKEKVLRQYVANLQENTHAQV